MAWSYPHQATANWIAVFIRDSFFRPGCGFVWAPRTEEDDLVFQTRNGTPFNDTNLLHRHLKPAGWEIGMPSLSWHTLLRTHATLLQTAGPSLRDTQAQLGHSRMSTTLEVYTLPIPAHLRLAVENLSQLVTNGDELHQSSDEALAAAE